MCGAIAAGFCQLRTPAVFSKGLLIFIVECRQGAAATLEQVLLRSSGAASPATAATNHQQTQAHVTLVTRNLYHKILQNIQMRIHVGSLIYSFVATRSKLAEHLFRVQFSSPNISDYLLKTCQPLQCVTTLFKTSIYLS